MTKPDRLARSTAELLTIEADLTKHGIGLIVLSMGGERLDTRNPTSKLMLTILAGVAAWEREIMLERQREGIAKAKDAGKYKRRPVSIDAPEVKRVARLIGPTAAAKQLGSPGAASTGCWKTRRERQFIDKINLITHEFSQLEQAVGHGWRPHPGPCETGDHGGEIVSPIEAVLELGEVARYVLGADGPIGAGDGEPAGPSDSRR